MAKQDENQDKTQTEEQTEEVTSTRDSPICVVPIYKNDVVALGFEVKEKDSKLNAEIRNKVRETLGLEIRVRTTGTMALLKDKLGLPADATQSEVTKAMKQKVLQL